VITCTRVREFNHEVRSQPECWRAAAAVAADRAGELPAAGARLAMVGCGTSLYMARAVAALREAGGYGETDAFPASEFPDGRGYDRVVVLTRSGTTTEVLRVLERLNGAAPTLVVTADPASPAAALAGSTVALDFADERSVVQTRFATSTLALFRAHLGEDLAPVIAAGERALTESLPEAGEGAGHIVFLGRGWTVGIAEEAALKLKEGARAYTEAYPLMEYRHGPISLAGPGSLVWLLDPGDETIATDIIATGAAVRQARLDPLAELVLVHRLVAARAARDHLDPDNPRHLTRSVVLP
jgi:fructoselysine-6-P-deglycase FrlB-like protein